MNERAVQRRMARNSAKGAAHILPFASSSVTITHGRVITTLCRYSDRCTRRTYECDGDIRDADFLPNGTRPVTEASKGTLPCQEQRQCRRYPDGCTPMKRTFLAIILASSAIVSAAFWVGPMRQNECQCLICHRERVEKWVCGAKIHDEITQNKYSDWMDTFTPPEHQHVWLTHTGYNRTHWFGRKSIACGGIPTIPRIFEQRNRLGELDAQTLATRFHELVKSQTPQSELDSFTRTIVEDPNSLLKTDAQD